MPSCAYRLSGQDTRQTESTRPLWTISMGPKGRTGPVVIGLSSAMSRRSEIGVGEAATGRFRDIDTPIAANVRFHCKRMRRPGADLRHGEASTAFSEVQPPFGRLNRLACNRPLRPSRNCRLGVAANDRSIEKFERPSIHVCVMGA